MQRLELSTQQALSHYLAHTLHTPDGVMSKGRVLRQRDIDRLQRAGIERLQVIRLDNADLHEDAAATQLATRLLGSGLALDRAEAGRCNLIATHRGLLQLDEVQIHALNELHESITLATLPPWSMVERGQVVASLKIIPFAIPRDLIGQWLGQLTPRATPIRMRRLETLPVALLRSYSGDSAPERGDRFEHLTARRLAYYGCVLSEVRHCTHDADAMAQQLAEMKSRCRLILVAGSSVTMDRQDVVPTALDQAGGETLHFGLPVEPGNMLLYGTLDDTQLISLPGCAKSAALNGLDLLLPRLAAGLPLERRDLTRLGVGGLLRNQQREFSQQGLRPVAKTAAVGATTSTAPVTALVLAAGSSRRMGCNKLLLPLDGRPMIQHTLDALQGSGVVGITLVSGHQSLLLRDTLHNHPLSGQLHIINNPGHADGLASSLRHGLTHLPPDHGGLLLMLGDMPLLTPALIDKLLSRFHALDGEKIVIPCYRGKRGHPRIWPAALAPMMALASGDRGADFLIRQNPAWVAELELDDPAVIRDFDTPEALSQWQP